jgi:cation diffusion facilitator CzcD-associated flavoprotein CzcO
MTQTDAGAVTYESRFQVLGLGPLNKPSIPDIPGAENFLGPRFHSMQWRHDIDFTGKRVAVIGTGASAIQFVPEIAKTAAQVTVFQRTPPWIVPRRDSELGSVHRSLRRIALFRSIERAFIYWRNELVAVAFLGNRSLLSLLKRVGRWHMKQTLRGRTDLESLLPNYDPGCKRLLLSDDWYPTLAKPNVRVVPGEPKRIESDAVITASDESIATDVIVYGTGFRIQEFVRPVRVVGVAGVEAGALWRAAPAPTYLGIAARSFPNSFALVGPNTGLRHNSIVFMIEAQVHWIVQTLKHARDNKAKRIEVSEAAQRDWYANVQQRMRRTVWASGDCKSYYQAADGRIDTLWPDYTWRYWLRTRKFCAADF